MNYETDNMLNQCERPINVANPYSCFTAQKLHPNEDQKNIAIKYVNKSCKITSLKNICQQLLFEYLLDGCQISMNNAQKHTYTHLSHTVKTDAKMSDNVIDSVWLSFRLKTKKTFAKNECLNKFSDFRLFLLHCYIVSTTQSFCLAVC